jgi:hypothetical protein
MAEEHRPRNRDLPACAEANTWTRITPERRSLAERYLEVMYQMNRPVYASEPASVVVPRMLGRRHEYYYFWNPQCEVVIGFHWRRRRRQYELKSLGFVGAITPAAALELMVAKLLDFMRQHDRERVFAIRPFAMESRSVIELYELAMCHPAVAIRGTHRVISGTYLWIRARHGTPCSEKLTQQALVQSAGRR